MVTLEVMSEIRDVCSYPLFDQFKEWADTKLPEDRYPTILSVPAMVGQRFEDWETDYLIEEIDLLKKAATEDWQKEILEAFEWAAARSKKFKVPIYYT